MNTQEGAANSLLRGIVIYFVLLVATSISFYELFRYAGSSVISSEAPNLQANYAFATFLTAPTHDLTSDDDDLYFTSARLLAYQLLHDPVTSTRQAIPFVVAVTPEVSLSKRARLERDGALVVEVPHLSINWVQPGAARWRDMMTKLRIFQLTQWDRVLFLDADTFVARNIDAIFEDPAAAVRPNRRLDEPGAANEDEGRQPADYVFAGNSGPGGTDHTIPPLKFPFLNGGFFLYRPSQEIFEYYATVANISGRYDGSEAEQSLLNYVHRWEGNLPWQQLHWSWNLEWPTYYDYEQGIATLHTKFWDTKYNEPRLFEVLLAGKRKMELYWEKYDA